MVGSVFALKSDEVCREPVKKGGPYGNLFRLKHFLGGALNPSKKARIVLLLREALLVAKDGSGDPSDDLSVGVRKALEALLGAIEGNQTHWQVFHRLLDAASWLANHYNISLAQALETGGIKLFLDTDLPPKKSP